MIRRLASVVVIAWVLGFALFTVSLPSPAPDALVTDAVVVPTGGPGRIDRGLTLLRSGKAKRMLVTGVDPDVRPGELAAAYKVPAEVIACCVDLGHEAVDTRSNADETAEWVQTHGYRTVRLVTSDWHMARAALELRHALDGGVEVIADPVPGTPRFGILFDEYNKYLVRRVVLWLGIGG
ncbi:YdcF family protein [Sphingomonas sp. ac-8]|uniref:YdcF family protein n=1 Tax=Sphingomonas sp. ac-8 TaxID=3242977 RepID=UPI003A805D7D